jgi:hypothetical protein
LRSVLAGALAICEQPALGAIHRKVSRLPRKGDNSLLPSRQRQSFAQVF